MEENQVMHQVHQREIMFMHDSMVQFHLQMREPHVNHSLRTWQELVDFSNQLEDKPFTQEVVDEEDGDDAENGGESVGKMHEYDEDFRG